MEKLKSNSRIFKFSSKKNDKIINTHSKQAREYAEKLENDPAVQSYETLVTLSKDLFKMMNQVDIRKSYFENDWVSDFLITYEDGRKSIREIIKFESLSRRAIIEQLELSRRYWLQTNIQDWVIVVFTGEKNVL